METMLTYLTTFFVILQEWRRKGELLEIDHCEYGVI